MTMIESSATFVETGKHSQLDVSVIIPVFNCAPYLWDTFGSLFAQDIAHDTFEIIAVDDGSTDASLAILESFSQRRSNMRVLSMEHTGSAAAPRNAGLDAASGRYVFFLDADDMLEPDALRKMVLVADETGSGVVLCKIEGSGGRVSGVPTRLFDRTRLAEDFIESGAYRTLGPWKLFRRSIIDDHKIRFALGGRIGEDLPFTLAAYLNSAHVSMISDKVYYWLHGRADGMNVTSFGQPAMVDLRMNLIFIRTVVDGTSPGERRDLLLRRPLMGKLGLGAILQRLGRQALDADEWRAITSDVRELVRPLWTDDLRSLAPQDTQVILDLVLHGDVVDAMSVCKRLSNGEALPIVADSQSSSFMYVPDSGKPVRGLNAALDVHVETLAATSQEVTLRTRVGAMGVEPAPDAVRLVWKHRRSGDEVAFGAQSEHEHSSAVGARLNVSAVSDMRMLKSRGHWDAFIEADWAEVRLRKRAGSRRDESIDTTTVLLGRPAMAAMYFTPYGNLSVDAGPTKKYPGDQVRVPAVVTGMMTISRRRVIFVEGNVGDVVSAHVVSPRSGRRGAARVRVLTSEALAVVLPKRLWGARELALVNVAGDTEHVSITGAVCLTPRSAMTDRRAAG